MSERIVLRQKINFETEIRAADPHNPESDDLQLVEQVFSLTPYGMLLVSLAGCTAVLLNTYAQNHNIGLTEVELRLEFGRVFADDCEQCEAADDFEEVIQEEMVFRGDLTPEQRQKLLAISRQCPVHRMLHEGIKVQSRLMDN